MVFVNWSLWTVGYSFTFRIIVRLYKYHHRILRISMIRLYRFSYTYSLWISMLHLEVGSLFYWMYCLDGLTWSQLTEHTCALSLIGLGICDRFLLAISGGFYAFRMLFRCCRLTLDLGLGCHGKICPPG